MKLLLLMLFVMNVEKEENEISGREKKWEMGKKRGKLLS